MKKIISVFLALVLVSAFAFAQNQNKKRDPEQWREKVRAEQVAFLTSELDLTEAEAQAFWPVYNSVQDKRRAAFKASSEAFKALKKGIDGEDVSALLDKYIAAKKACEAIDEEALASFKSVLPVQKVAKLYLAEEKFRHQQIGKFGKGGRPGERSGDGARRGNGRRSPQGRGLNAEAEI